MNKRVTIILAFSSALLLGLLLFLSQSVSVSGSGSADRLFSLPGAPLTQQRPKVQFRVSSQSITEQNPGITTPASIVVQLDVTSTLDVLVSYDVSGTAVDGTDYTEDTGGSLVIPAGDLSADISITVIGDDLYEADETAVLSLGTPTNADLGTRDRHTVTIVDDDDAPSLSFSAADYTVNENQSAQVTVLLSPAAGRTVTVDYATANRTAEAGEDYIAANGTLTFFPGQTSKSFSVTIIDDVLDEDQEEVWLTLASADPGEVQIDGFARLFINDNDGASTVGFSSATYTVDEDGGTATIQVTLDTVSGRTVTVDYETSPATATEWGDYRPAAGTLTFDPGQTSKSFAVTIIDDNVNENDREEINLTLSNPSNVNLGVAQATLTILDDDVGPTSTTSPTPPGIPGAPDNFEPNYDFGRATLIGLGTEYRNLNFVPWAGTNPDNDFYKLWVVAGKLYTCETFDLGAATNTNMILYSGPGQEYGFSGNDDVEPFDPADPYRSRIAFFSSYNGYVYILLGQVGAERILPEEWKDLSYSLKCFIGQPGTATPTPTSQFIPPTPQPTSVPDQNTPLPSPTSVQLVVLPMTTPTPPSASMPAATPTPELYVIELSLYYDRNGNAQADPAEGIVDVLARAHDAIGGDLLSIDYTDETGRLRFTVPGKGPVRVSVPFFGFDQIVTARNTSIQIRISPRP